MPTKRNKKVAKKKVAKKKSVSKKRQPRKADRSNESAAGAKSFSDTPWNGAIDDDELLRPGGALLAMLSGRAKQLNHTRAQIAEHLGVTYGYIAQLASGHRKTYQISSDFAEACARYLGVPKITVLMASGSIKPEDMFERPDDIGTALPSALELIEKDAVFGPLVPPEVMATDASPRLQFFVVRLFEAARGLKLIPGEHTIESIADALKRIEETRARLLRGS